MSPLALRLWLPIQASTHCSVVWLIGIRIELPCPQENDVQDHRTEDDHEKDRSCNHCAHHSQRPDPRVVGANLCDHMNLVCWGDPVTSLFQAEEEPVMAEPA